MRVNWRGTWAHLITVTQGPAGAFHHPQDAIDSIMDAAHDNRYLVHIAGGYWDFGIQPAIWLDKSHVDIVGDGPDKTILAGNGADRIRIGAPEATAVVEDVGVYDLRAVVWNMFPPNPAIHLGARAGPGLETYPWDEVTISNCVIEGDHDALQWHAWPVPGKPGKNPRLTFMNNKILSKHDAVTWKGSSGDITSINNLILADGRIDSGQPLYVDGRDPLLWKTTGIHISLDTMRETEAIEGRQMVSVRDTFRVYGGDKVMLTGAQAACSGLYIYQANDLILQTVAPAVRLVEPDMLVTWEAGNNTRPVRTFSGISVIYRNTAGGTFWENHAELPEGLIQVSGGQIVVWNQSAEFGSPSRVPGVHMRTGNRPAGAARHVQIAGTHIYARNDRGGGGPASSLWAEDVGDTITAKTFTQQTGTGNGTISAMGMQP